MSQCFVVVVALLLNEVHHQMPSEFHLLLHCFVTVFFFLCSGNQDIIINIISLAVSKIYCALVFSFISIGMTDSDSELLFLQSQP